MVAEINLGLGPFLTKLKVLPYQAFVKHFVSSLINLAKNNLKHFTENRLVLVRESYRSVSCSTYSGKLYRNCSLSML